MNSNDDVTAAVTSVNMCRGATAGGAQGRAFPSVFHTLAKDLSLIEAQHILLSD